MLGNEDGVLGGFGTLLGERAVTRGLKAGFGEELEMGGRLVIGALFVQQVGGGEGVEAFGFLVEAGEGAVALGAFERDSLGGGYWPLLGRQLRFESHLLALFYLQLQVPRTDLFLPFRLLVPLQLLHY